MEDSDTGEPESSTAHRTTTLFEPQARNSDSRELPRNAPRNVKLHEALDTKTIVLYESQEEKEMLMQIHSREYTLRFS